MNLSSAIAAGGADVLTDVTANLGALAVVLIPVTFAVSIFGLIIRKARAR